MFSIAELPPNSCDCHVHVVGPAEEYLMEIAHRYTPGSAPLAALRVHFDLAPVFRTP